MCLPSKLKLPTQAPNNITGKVTPSSNVIFFDVKFDVASFDVKIFSMCSFWYYSIQS